jgi:acetoin utilization protein AcuB
MYVGLKMLRDFVTVTPKTLVKEADKLMEQNQLWMLLVVEEDQLVGYVRKEDIRAALPSMITSLEKHELNYLLSKLTIEKIIREDITSVSPETEIEGAAALMYEKNLAGLAVVGDNDKLIGYINRSVMLQVLVEEMGFLQGGSRIVFEVEDRPGVIAEVSGLITKMEYSIISTGTFFHDSRRMVVFRVDTDDPSRIAAALQDLGYKLVGAEDFMHEWQ